MRSALVTSFDPSTDPQAPSDYAIRAILDGLDQVAAEMERKWGGGRLRLLVSDLLRAKFDTQKDKLGAAIASNQEHYIRAQAEGMKRAWAALDRAATDVGHPPLSPTVWECVLPSSGEVVGVVRTEAEAHHVCREMRVCQPRGNRPADRRTRADGVGGETRVSWSDSQRHPQAADRLAEGG